MREHVNVRGKLRTASQSQISFFPINSRSSSLLLTKTLENCEKVVLKRTHTHLRFDLLLELRCSELNRVIKKRTRHAVGIQRRFVEFARIGQRQIRSVQLNLSVLCVVGDNIVGRDDIYT